MLTDNGLKTEVEDTIFFFFITVTRIRMIWGNSYGRPPMFRQSRSHLVSHVEKTSPCLRVPYPSFLML